MKRGRRGRRVRVVVMEKGNVGGDGSYYPYPPNRLPPRHGRRRCPRASEPGHGGGAEADGRPCCRVLRGGSASCLGSQVYGAFGFSLSLFLLDCLSSLDLLSPLIFHCPFFPFVCLLLFIYSPSLHLSPSSFPPSLLPSLIYLFTLSPIPSTQKLKKRRNFTLLQDINTASAFSFFLHIYNEKYTITQPHNYTNSDYSAPQDPSVPGWETYIQPIIDFVDQHVGR